LACLALLIAPLPASASHGPYYGQQARTVAQHLGCTNFSSSGSGMYNSAGGVCWLKGRRVNVILFAGLAKQQQWIGAARLAFGPRFHWASGRGAIVVAKYGSLDAARVGARALPGVVMQG